MKRVLLALCLPALLAGCACQPKPGLTHVVVVWLKQPGNEADRARLVNTAKDLKARIPELEALTVGRPLPKRGPFDDVSYDVAMVMRFRDEAALASYRTNAVHQRALREVLSPMMRRAVVYDYLDE